MYMHLVEVFIDTVILMYNFKIQHAVAARKRYGIHVAAAHGIQPVPVGLRQPQCKHKRTARRVTGLK